MVLHICHSIPLINLWILKQHLEPGAGVAVESPPRWHLLTFKIESTYLLCEVILYKVSAGCMEWNQSQCPTTTHSLFLTLLEVGTTQV